MTKMWMDALEIFHNYDYMNLSTGDIERIQAVLNKYVNIENGLEILKERINDTIDHFQKQAKESLYKANKLQQFLNEQPLDEYFKTKIGEE